MCFIAVLFQVHPHYPLVVAANRNESRSRKATAPHRWEGTPTVWAGRDDVAGGTWLGVNERGLLVALTNRVDGSTDRSLPSRGILCLDALRQPSPDEALALTSERLDGQEYNPFNLLAASPWDAWVTTWKGDTRRLPAGIHVITNHGDVDDEQIQSIARAGGSLRNLPLATSTLDDLLSQLARLCADTTNPDPICRAGGARGTVSSSIIALAPDGSLRAYRHADGPPCERPYADILDDGALC